MKHDEHIEIATGNSRRSISWKNEEILWSEFVDRLRETHRTAEKFTEYMKAAKTRQDEIKDIGGFVGGYLSSGRRKTANVVTRSLIVLDADYPPAGLWEDFTLMYGCAAAMHTTHKHSAENPRIRLIIPLDRPVDAGEYEPIARRVASMLNMQRFDHTTYETARLMYWPSTSADGEYLFNVQDGVWLCADRVLATYWDYRNSSEWPVSERENTVIRGAIKNQEDPLTKRGLIGAFCRAYSVEDAIETILSDQYTTCGIEGRYTYAGGSTAAGLVVYDGKFVYSHHGTDPVSGMLCNAFDLVRVHKFGRLDENAEVGTPTNKRPSFKAMEGFILEDERTMALIGVEKLTEAREAFADEFPENEIEGDEDMAWTKRIKRDKSGNTLNTLENISVIMSCDPLLKNKIYLDTFQMREAVRGNLPWRKVTGAEDSYLSDNDMAHLHLYLEKIHGISSVPKVEMALKVVTERNKIHPIREYLRGLKWDGTGRLDTLLIDYLGVEDSPYTRAVTRKTLTAAVARVMRPGCKFDYVLTLIGKQGLKKSSLIDRLGKGWFSDSFTTMQGKEAYEQLRGSWLIEIAELSGMRKADIETVKHFITKRKDKYRVAYGHRIDEFPRQCIFIATTNDATPLRDSTGNRRFWPVSVHALKPTRNAGVGGDLTEDEVNQIWAEAVIRYNEGEPLYLTEELEETALGKQEQHSEEDARYGLIEQFLEVMLPPNWEEKNAYERRAYLSSDEEIKERGSVKRKRVCIAEIWCEIFGGTIRDMTTQNTKALHEIMRKMDGWKQGKSKTRFQWYGTQIAYFFDEKKAATDLIKAATKHSKN